MSRKFSNLFLGNFLEILHGKIFTLFREEQMELHKIILIIGFYSRDPISEVSFPIHTR